MDISPKNTENLITTLLPNDILYNILFNNNLDRFNILYLLLTNIYLNNTIHKKYSKLYISSKHKKINLKKYNNTFMISLFECD